MAVSTDLITLLPRTISDDNTNGGRASSNRVVSGQLQNVWPHVPRAERIAGSTKYRKLFDRFANDDDETLIDPGYYLDGDTPGDDYITFFPTTALSTQGDGWATVPASQMYGSGYLAVSVSAGASSIQVQLADASITGIFRDTMYIRIADRADPDSVTGVEEFRTISGTPSVSGSIVTITLDSGLGNAYTAGTATKISGVYQPGDLSTSLDGVTVTSPSGTFDDSLVDLDNIATLEQQITITFSTATDFTATSNDPNVTLVAGSTGAAYSPQNPDESKPYLTIPTSAWGGTFAVGDTVVFTTHAADVATVQKRVIPANSASLANNFVRKVTLGESQT